MLIRNTDIAIGDFMHRAIRDVQITGTVIAAIGEQLAPGEDEPVLDAGGGALLPGLNDHHIHLAGLAAAQESLHCGPPDVSAAEALAERLRDADRQSTEWLRGIGYHESVAGEINRHWLDIHLPHRAARIQHRSGRLWILNSVALKQLGVSEVGAGNDPLERIDGRLTGRLYDADPWLRERLRSTRPSLHELSRLLARQGITGVTDTSAHNGLDDYRWFAEARQRGELLQRLVVMGNAELDDATHGAHLFRGATKFHLHDTELPDFDGLCNEIRRSHAARRTVAFHCVSRTDLMFALAALSEAGCLRGDRIEHASITPPEAIELIRTMPLTVVTQPGFIYERGDAYLDDVSVDDQAWLYRLRAFIDAGIPLAGSSDAPYGNADPWRAMEAAVTRRTASGTRIGSEEALSAEQALALFTSPLTAPGTAPPALAVGSTADLCLLNESWQTARNRLSAVCVRATFIGGRPVQNL
jgi:predicted amidohydrolase YtcJ